MATSVNGSVSIGTTATLIVSGPSVANLTDNFPVILSNLGEVDVYIGASSITAGSGPVITPGSTLYMGNFVNDSIYGAVTAGTGTIGYALFSA